MPSKIIIGIIGENASGKTTATDYLKEKYGAVSFRFSDMLADILKRLYLEPARNNFQILSTILRQNFSEDIMSRVIAEDVKNSPANLIITEGVRRPTDIVYLKNNHGFKLIALKTDEKIRYERLKQRQEKQDDATKTWKEFQAEGQQESEQKIKEVDASADFSVDNNGSIDDLKKQLDEIAKSLGLS